MRVFIGVLLLVAAALAEVKVAENAEIPLEQDNTAFKYHEKVGVKEAARIKEAESKLEFNATGRIVGGSVTPLGAIPYQAGIVITLTVGWTSVCGGALISNTRVLTAAHCWFDGWYQASSFEVVLGSVTLFTGGTRIVSSDVTVHAGWNPNLVQNDLAMINIEAVTYTDTIRNIALPFDYLVETFSGYTAIASGYGMTTNGGSITTNQVLSHIWLNVINQNTCNAFYYVHVLDNQICTSGAGGIGTCGGDSGGPVAIDWNNERILIGIISYGSAAGCHVGYPAVHSRVTEFNVWILNHL